jgi:hypothetical protein
LQDAITPDLLEHIRNRAGDSTLMEPDIAEILIEQGIINLED